MDRKPVTTHLTLMLKWVQNPFSSIDTNTDANAFAQCAWYIEILRTHKSIDAFANANAIAQWERALNGHQGRGYSSQILSV